MVNSLKRAVICEELIELFNGDAHKAVIIKQMLYWFVRVSEFDSMLQKVVSMEGVDGDSDCLTHIQEGWIYKTADELASETMMSSGRSVSRKLSDLVKDGYLYKRNNPKNPWDRTSQYFVNLPKIHLELEELGYSLSTVMGKDYPLVKAMIDRLCPITNADSGNNSNSHQQDAEEGVCKQEISEQENESMHARTLKSKPDTNDNDTPNIQSRQGSELLIPPRDEPSLLSYDEETLFFQQAVAYKLANDSRMERGRAESIVTSMVRRIKKGDLEAQDRLLLMLFKKGTLEKYLSPSFVPARDLCSPHDPRKARLTARLLSEGKITEQEAREAMQNN
ncbi:MAG: hypothetical protein ACLFTJ_02505 [Halothece sp.]